MSEIGEGREALPEPNDAPRPLTEEEIAALRKAMASPINADGPGSAIIRRLLATLDARPSGDLSAARWIESLPEKDGLVWTTKAELRSILDARPSDEALRTSVAVAIHRWKHPTKSLAFNECRCRADAEMALSIARDEGLLAAPVSPSPDVLDVERLARAIEAVGDHIEETDCGGYDRLPHGDEVAREYAALRRTPHA